MWCCLFFFKKNDCFWEQELLSCVAMGVELEAMINRFKQEQDTVFHTKKKQCLNPFGHTKALYDTGDLIVWFSVLPKKITIFFFFLVNHCTFLRVNIKAFDRTIVFYLLRPDLSFKTTSSFFLSHLAWVLYIINCQSTMVREKEYWYSNQTFLVMDLSEKSIWSDEFNGFTYWGKKGQWDKAYPRQGKWWLTGI